MICLDDEFIDPYVAEALLNVALDRPTRLAKSFYNFDFSTFEGVTSFLSLLPTLDAEVVKQAVAEVWPGAVDDSFDPKRARIELRGYFMDTLAEGVLLPPEQEEAAAQQASADLAQEPAEEATEAPPDEQQAPPDEGEEEQEPPDEGAP